LEHLVKLRGYQAQILGAQWLQSLAHFFRFHVPCAFFRLFFSVPSTIRLEIRTHLLVIAGCGIDERLTRLEK